MRPNVTRLYKTASEIANALGAKKTTNGWIANCPAHDDKHPSLSISDGVTGLPIWHCHAGCSQEAVRDALVALGLYVVGGQSKSRFWIEGHGNPTHEYQYVSASGELVMVVCRYEPKTFRPWTPVNGRWTRKAFVGPRPLYGLAKLAEHPKASVIVVEGEGVADALQPALPDGWVSISWPGGAKGVHGADWGPISGRAIGIWGDNDAAGRAAAEVVREITGGHIMALPDWPEKWDAVDALKDVSFDLRAFLSQIPLPFAPPSYESLEITQDEYALSVLTPDCIVQDYLYADVCVHAGPGGIGKTTLGLYEAAHIAIGRPLYGRTVMRPGRVLIVTAEDRRSQTIARLCKVAESLDGFSGSERAMMFRNVLIWDVTEQSPKLAEASGKLATRVSDFGRMIVDAYRDDPPTMIVFDPLMSFGPGELSGNDGMQAIITASRLLVRGLNCCVKLVHHISQVSARGGLRDQYSVRGGTALVDGARTVVTLSKLSPDERLTSNVPDHAEVLVLAMPKQSYSAPQEPIWITRSGWHFAVNEYAPATATERQQGIDDMICGYVSERQGAYLSRRSLEECVVELPHGLGRNDARRAIRRLVDDGRLVEIDLPDGVKRRGQSCDRAHRN